jgi:hypothetical protein
MYTPEQEAAALKIVEGVYGNFNRRYFAYEFQKAIAELIAERDGLKADLDEALSACRDAFAGITGDWEPEDRFASDRCEAKLRAVVAKSEGMAEPLPVEGPAEEIGTGLYRLADGQEVGHEPESPER